MHTYSAAIFQLVCPITSSKPERSSVTIRQRLRSVMFKQGSAARCVHSHLLSCLRHLPSLLSCLGQFPSWPLFLIRLPSLLSCLEDLSSFLLFQIHLPGLLSCLEDLSSLLLFLIHLPGLLSCLEDLLSLLLFLIHLSGLLSWAFVSHRAATEILVAAHAYAGTQTHALQHM